MTTLFHRFGFALAFYLLAAQSAGASNVYEVRETWELQLDTPNLAKNTPQFVTHFKIDDDAFILTTFNFRQQPAYEPGGIQLQLWEQGVLVDRVDVTLDSLDVSSDVIAWTHVYKIDQATGTVTMKVANVQSQAWGSISDTESVVQDPGTVSTFDNYDAAASVAESHISFGSNAVVWFGMTESSTYDENGNVLTTDSTPRTVYDR